MVSFVETIRLTLNIDSVAILQDFVGRSAGGGQVDGSPPTLSFAVVATRELSKILKHLAKVEISF